MKGKKMKMFWRWDMLCRCIVKAMPLLLSLFPSLYFIMTCYQKINNFLTAQRAKAKKNNAKRICQFHYNAILASLITGRFQCNKRANIFRADFDGAKFIMSLKRKGQKQKHSDAFQAQREERNQINYGHDLMTCIVYLLKLLS